MQRRFTYKLLLNLFAIHECFVVHRRNRRCNVYFAINGPVGTVLRWTSIPPFKEATYIICRHSISRPKCMFPVRSPNIYSKYEDFKHAMSTAISSFGRG